MIKVNYKGIFGSQVVRYFQTLAEAETWLRQVGKFNGDNT